MATPTQVQRIFALVHSPSGLSFPRTVATLLDAGVSNYHADYASSIVTTYTPDTTTKTITTEQIPIPSPSITADPVWNKSGLIRAIERVQNGEFKNYTEFAKACCESGVVGYMAFLPGQKVTYYGCEGVIHIEWFPGAGPKQQE